MKVYITIPREHGESEIEFKVKVTPGYPGRQYLPNGDPGYPDEPPEVEVLGAWLCRKWDQATRKHKHRRVLDHDTLLQDDNLWRRVEDKALEAADEAYEDAKQDAAEAAGEARRDALGGW